MTYSSTLTRVLIGLALPVILFIAWWYGSANGGSIFYPPLSAILNNLWSYWFGTLFFADVLPSLIRFVIGFCIALVVGVLLGLVMGMSPRVRASLFPETEFLRATPIAALVPAALVLIGPGATMEVTLIAFGSLWPILINTIDGVRSVDPMHVSMARVYGLKKSARVRRIVLPEATPQIFAGIEVALPIGIATMVIANMVGASNGIGHAVINAQQSFNIVATWSGLILIGLIGVTVSLIFAIVRMSVLRWYAGWRALGDS